MLSNSDGRDSVLLRQQFKEQVSELVELVGLPAVPLDVDPTPGGNFRGYDGGQFYVVLEGSLTVKYQDKTVYMLEVGDILLPDIAGNQDAEISVYYGSDSGARLHSYPGLEFMQRVFNEPAAVRLWTRLLIVYAGLMLRITAVCKAEDTPTTPGFEIYEPGEIIIRQGERADYVFNMTSGVAEVLVDDVNVGRIGDGEIFGAMAALTQSDRSATVQAKTTCSVVKVPKDQFTDLIRNNPATIQSLLVDMAHSIVNLNEQLVGIGSHE